MQFKPTEVSPARKERRQRIVEVAKGLVGAESTPEFDAVHSPLCAIDVVMVAGAPWLRDGLERDFFKDESGYRKIGGGANTPQMAYFFRSCANLVHYLKRQGFYVPRGASPGPEPGMACFFDWDDRGRFNFKPDRSGIVVGVQNGEVREVVMAKDVAVQLVRILPGDNFDHALIGYSDLP